MYKKILKITNEYGIHARPAALIVKKLQIFNQKYFLRKMEIRYHARVLWD